MSFRAVEGVNWRRERPHGIELFWLVDGYPEQERILFWLYGVDVFHCFPLGVVVCPCLKIQNSSVKNKGENLRACDFLSLGHEVQV